MLRNAHSKIFAISAGVLTVILIGTLVVLNLVVQHTSEGSSKAALEAILRTGGDPDRAARDAQGAAGAVLSDYDMLRTSSYFLVRTTGSRIASADLKYAGSMEEGEARALAALAIEGGDESGRLGQHAYLRQLGPNGATYAFLDVSAQLQMQSRLLVTSAAVGAVGEALMLLFLGFVTVRWVRPAEQLLAASRDIMEKGASGMEAGAVYLISAYRERGSAQASPALREGVVLEGIATDLRGVAYAIGRPKRPQSVDISELLRQAATENETLFAEKDLELHAAVEEDVLLKAQPEELRALFEILMVHACENGEAGGDVYLDVLTDGSDAGVIVRYTVEELPPVPADALLDGDYSRSAAQSGGLYAARLLAHLNGGDLVCEYLEPPAVCFTLRFRRRGRSAGR